MSLTIDTETYLFLQNKCLEAKDYAETQQWQSIVIQFENILQANIQLSQNNAIYSDLNEVKYEN